MELTIEQIIKALECCNSEGHICGKCPYKSVRIGISCRDMLSRDALALITSQDQRIKELAEENERYKRYYLNHEYDKMEADIKADTVRKMQERLKAKAKNNEWNGTICGEDIDQIAKEMLEEQNEDKK